MDRDTAVAAAQRQADEWQRERWAIIGGTGWIVRNPSGKPSPMTVRCLPRKKELPITK